jgi:hypothetical protein
MTKQFGKYFLLASALLLTLNPATLAQGKKATIIGHVYDSACYYTKNISKPISHECAMECAAAGSPLVIVAEDGTVYLPVDKKMPALGQNYRLAKFGGLKVKATGEVYVRKGSTAIVLETIEETK